MRCIEIKLTIKKRSFLNATVYILLVILALEIQIMYISIAIVGYVNNVHLFPFLPNKDFAFIFEKKNRFSGIILLGGEMIRLKN